MSVFYNIFFGLRDNLKNILRSLVSSFGILFLITFFIIYISFRDSVTKYVSSNLFDNLASDEIKILPKGATSVEFVRSSGGSSIPGSLIAKLKASPDFTQVYSVARIGLSVKVKAEMFGKTKTMYVPVCGVERGFLKGKDKLWQSFTNHSPVPMIAPKFTLDMFNNYLALDGLPTISEKQLIGWPLKMVVTSKKDEGKKQELQYDAEIYSFADVISFPGAIVPMDFLGKISSDFRKQYEKSSGFEYIVVFAKVKNTKQLPEITASLSKLGLKVESQQDIAEKTGKAMRIIDGFSLVIIGIFFLLTAISIFNSYLTIVYIRSQKFSLKRVLGFSKFHILVTFIMEAAIVGALYGIAGYFIGNFLIYKFSVHIADWVPALKGIDIKTDRHGVLFLCVAISAAVSSIAALLPAVFASNINLFKAVRK
jgi:ABC-type antimicrobial peptide transport system permease subunit